MLAACSDDLDVNFLFQIISAEGVKEMKFSLESEYGEIRTSNGRVRPVAPRVMVAHSPPLLQRQEAPRTYAPLATPQLPMGDGQINPSKSALLSSAACLVDPQRCSILDRLARSIVPSAEDFRHKIVCIAREAILFHCPSIPVDEVVNGVATVTEIVSGPTSIPRYTETAELERQVHLAAIDWLKRENLLIPHRRTEDVGTRTPSKDIPVQVAEHDVLSTDYEERLATLWNRRDASLMVAVPQFRSDGSVLVIGIVKCSAKGVFRWQLGIGNRISAELVQLGSLQHLRLVETQIVHREEHDGGVTTTTSLELSRQALRPGTQYTVWLICLEGGREFTDLQTFFVP